MYCLILFCPLFSLKLLWMWSRDFYGMNIANYWCTFNISVISIVTSMYAYIIFMQFYMQINVNGIYYYYCMQLNWLSQECVTGVCVRLGLFFCVVSQKRRSTSRCYHCNYNTRSSRARACYSILSGLTFFQSHCKNHYLCLLRTYDVSRHFAALSWSKQVRNMSMIFKNFRCNVLLS